MKAIYTIQNFAKRLVMVLAVGLMAVNVWGTTYTYDLHSVAAATGGSNVTYWYSDNTCTTHLKTRSSGNYDISTSTDPVTIYYKDATLPTTEFSVAASSTSNYVAFMAASPTALVMGKNGAIMNLPTYSGEKITNVTITTGSGCSTNVTFSVYSGTNRADGTNADKTGAISTEYSFDISTTYQSTALKVKVTNAYNLQIATLAITTAPDGYAVTYNNGGHGTAPSSTTATAVTLSAITATGYTNTGWTANQTVTVGGAIKSAGTLLANGSTATLSAATTFTAQWGANNYTVTLDDDGGSGGSGSKTVTYNANTNLTTSVAIPTKSHHTFGGYFTAKAGGGTQLINADGSWKASVASYTDGSKNWIKADNVTLYAKWTGDPLTNYHTRCLTVTYAAGEGSGVGPSNHTMVNPNSTITLEANTFTAPTGKAFDGWHDGTSKYAAGASYTVTASKTMTAQWAFIDYNVTYSAPSNGNYTIKVADGEASSATKTAHYGQTITLNATPNTGCSFTSWTVTKAGGGTVTVTNNQFTMPAENVTVTATFTIIDYNVTYVAPSNGNYTIKVGSGTASSASKTANYGQTITLAATPNTGYSFSSWTVTKASSGTVTVTSNQFTMPAEDVTVTAAFSANNYTITLNNQSATTAGTANIAVTYNASTNLTATPAITVPTKTGYTFGGYYTEVGGSGTQIIAANGNVNANAGSSTYTDSNKKWKYANNITLYAKWTAKTITITWNPNGEGATVSPTSSSYTYDGSTVTLPTPTRSLSVFTGWYTEESGGTEITEVGTTNKPTENVTYYAHWRVLAFEVKDQAGTGTADIHLTSTRGVTVYATSGCGNLITIKADNLDAISNLGGGTANKQNIQIKYLDANNGDAEVAKANSPFRLCNNGSSNYNNADGGNINLNGLTNYSQTYSISYTPSEYGKIDHYKLQLRLQNNNTNAITITFDLYGRSLPDEFVIAAKYADDGKWYALPNTLGTTSSASAPTPTEITVDNVTSPTRAMNVPSSLIYKACDRYKNSPNTQFASIRFSSDGRNHLQASTSASSYQLWLAPSGTNAVAQNWYLNSSDFSSYLVQLDPANSNSKKLGFYNSSGIKMGFHGTAPKGCDIYFLSTGEEYEAEVQAWTEHDMLVELESSITSNGVTATLDGTTVTGTATGSGTTYIVHTAGLNYAGKSGKELVIRWKNNSTILGTTKIEMPNVIALSAGNWPTSSAPTIDDYVVLKGATTVTVTNAKAKDVVLDKSDGNSGTLTINAGKELVVNQKVHMFNGSSFGATGEFDIEFGSTSAAGLGALAMGTHDGTNKATVNFYTRSNGKKETNTSVGQYVGTPFNDETNILYNWYNSWIYRIVYNSGVIGWERVNEGEGMDPFKGYCVFSADAWDNDAGHSYWMQGTLVTSANQTCSGLNWQSGSGTANLNNENLLANSWMAPIKIKAMQTSDFHNADATIYIFNSTSSSAYENLAGNYDTYTVNVSEAVIPAMQSFSVFTTGSGASVTLDYNRIVYAPAVAGTATPTANKAPQRAGASEDEADKMRLFVRTEDGYGDMLYMWEREDFEEGFENGWDGHKLFGESYAPQLYAITPDGEMAVNCVPDWEGTVLGFKKGTEDNVYTFTFEYEGENTWYLNDLKAEQSTRILSGNTYAFSTASGDMEARFIISATPISYVPTAIENGEAETTIVRKLLIDDHVYIIRNGRMYDATGVMVK